MTESGSESGRGDELKARAERESVFLLAIVNHADGVLPAVSLRIRNISAGGVLAEGPHNLSADQRVNTEIRNLGLIPGHVAWVTPTRAGIAFDVTIDPKAARKPVGGGSRH